MIEHSQNDTRPPPPLPSLPSHYHYPHCNNSRMITPAVALCCVAEICASNGSTCKRLYMKFGLSGFWHPGNQIFNFKPSKLSLKL